MILLLQGIHSTFVPLHLLKRLSSARLLLSLLPWRILAPVSCLSIPALLSLLRMDGRVVASVCVCGGDGGMMCKAGWWVYKIEVDEGGGLLHMTTQLHPCAGGAYGSSFLPSCPQTDGTR